MKMFQLEIYDACCSEVVERSFYSSREAMEKDFPEIEKNYANGHSFDDHEVTAKIVMKNENEGELKILKSDGKRDRESYYINVKEVEIKK